MANLCLLPQLQTLLDQTREIKESAIKLQDEIKPDQWVWVPTKRGWSIAQTIDHLNKIGYLVLPHIQSSIQELQARHERTDGPFQYSFLERLFIRFNSPNPPWKSPVPPLYAPQMSSDSADILPRFLNLQELLLESLTEADRLPITTIKFSSPVSERIRFSLGAWLETIVGHERYHWLQVDSLRSASNFPH